MKRSKAAASKASDVAQVGLRRGGEPTFAQNAQKPRRAAALGGHDMKAHGLVRGGSTKIASYATSSKGYDIGRKRAGDNYVPATPHPGTVAGATKRERRQQGRDSSARTGSRKVESGKGSEMKIHKIEEALGKGD